MEKHTASTVLLISADLLSKGTQQAVADWHLTEERELRGSSWLQLVSIRDTRLEFFHLSFVPYMTALRTSLVLAQISARFFPKANTNDFLSADKSTVHVCFSLVDWYKANNLLVYYGFFLIWFFYLPKVCSCWLRFLKHALLFKAPIASSCNVKYLSE